MWQKHEAVPNDSLFKLAKTNVALFLLGIFAANGRHWIIWNEHTHLRWYVRRYYCEPRFRLFQLEEMPNIFHKKCICLREGFQQILLFQNNFLFILCKVHAFISAKKFRRHQSDIFQTQGTAKQYLSYQFDEM